MPPPFRGFGPRGFGPGALLVDGLVAGAVIGGAMAASRPPPRRHHYQVYTVAPRGQPALGPNERLILIKCPPGVGPGAMIELEVEGQAFRVAVPRGIRPHMDFYARVRLQPRTVNVVPAAARAQPVVQAAAPQAQPSVPVAVPEAQTVTSSNAPVAEVQPASASTADANPFGDQVSEANPFSDSQASGWVIAPLKAEFDQFFYAQGPQDNKLNPAQVKAALLTTGLPTAVLRTVWELSDIDKDGQLDIDEFAVAMYLCRQSQANKPLPKELPADVMPPSKIVGNPF